MNESLWLLAKQELLGSQDLNFYICEMGMNSIIPSVSPPPKRLWVKHSNVHYRLLIVPKRRITTSAFLPGWWRKSNAEGEGLLQSHSKGFGFGALRDSMRGCDRGSSWSPHLVGVLEAMRVHSQAVLGLLPRGEPSSGGPHGRWAKQSPVIYSHGKWALGKGRSPRSQPPSLLIM